MNQNPETKTPPHPDATRQLVGDSYHWVMPNGDVLGLCNRPETDTPPTPIPWQVAGQSESETLRIFAESHAELLAACEKLLAGCEAYLAANGHALQISGMLGARAAIAKAGGTL